MGFVVVVVCGCVCVWVFVCCVVLWFLGLVLFLWLVVCVVGCGLVVCWDCVMGLCCGVLGGGVLSFSVVSLGYVCGFVCFVGWCFVLGVVGVFCGFGGVC